ncbi:hypothetical protein DYBT9275_04273 [Dyadobacter sp. CECT 9275]|uniref:Uncharacterized protein n=1 Tax=Dyadobacter helix TaxID=2822344 RepID=A0A916JF24_9BACT|nr:hypothetical protein [Dyadobacter sp. CECT 9275]CAG5008457.1 hypothetical protein DYBT9275_04273 [Dyadobacter sp. CECT 9275]
MLFLIIPPVLLIAGGYFLLKSIKKIVQINSGKKIEFPASLSLKSLILDVPGIYEIAYKRPSVWGSIPTDISFRIIQLRAHKEYPVSKAVNLFGARKDTSGSRIVPVAEFTVDEAHDYELQTIGFYQFENGDEFIISPKTGYKGFVIMFTIAFSALVMITGLVLSIMMVLTNKF